MTEHSGLPVQGYQPQSADNVDTVNVNKTLEEMVLRQIEKIQKGDADQRMCALAITNLQQGFMWLNRAVFKPGRVKLPGDE